jgi:hypothetical protein
MADKRVVVRSPYFPQPLNVSVEEKKVVELDDEVVSEQPSSSSEAYISLDNVSIEPTLGVGIGGTLSVAPLCVNVNGIAMYPTAFGLVFDPNPAVHAHLESELSQLNAYALPVRDMVSHLKGEVNHAVPTPYNELCDKDQVCDYSKGLGCKILSSKSRSPPKNVDLRYQKVKPSALVKDGTVPNPLLGLSLMSLDGGRAGPVVPPRTIGVVKKKKVVVNSAQPKVVFTNRFTNHFYNRGSRK